MKRILITVFFAAIYIITNAQDDLQLAMTYFKSHDYDKAAVLFKKVYKEKKSTFYFDYYIDCLVNLKDYKTAEKEIKREIKKNSNNLIFYIDLGYIYEIQGDINEADKQFKFVIKNLPQNIVMINNISNTFIKRGKIKYAEKTLLKGSEWFPDSFLYSFIVVYNYMRNYEKLVNAYLDYLKKDNTQLKMIETNISNYMKNDVNNEFSDILEQTIIQRIQKDNDDIFYELLIWFYIQKDNFPKALTFAKSIDFRNHENGNRIYKLGNSAYNAEDYNTAKDAFEYLLTKGRMTTYYEYSKKMILKIMYNQVKDGENNLKFEEVEKSYLDFINEFGLNIKTVDIILNLADLEAFYLDSTEKAIELIEKSLAVKGLDKDLKSKLMLKQGDIYVANNDLWKSILVYAKIEEEFPNNKISDEAKFKKAKSYFYVGMIEHAQREWDILKGSPAKLIANDAIYWTTFVDEFSTDSTHSILKSFARADLAYYQRKFDKSILICDSIISQKAASNAKPAILYLKSQNYIAKGEYEKAAENLEIIANQYGFAMWSDKAIFELADLYETKLDNKEKAKSYFKKLLFEYKGSVFSDMAKERFLNLTE